MSVPHGKAVSQAEVRRRLLVCEELLAGGAYHALVIAEMRKAFPGIAARTVCDYITRVRAKWNKEAEASRPTERAATIQRLERRALVLWQGSRDATGIERLLVDIKGLKAPAQIEHTGAAGAPLFTMSERSRRIATLLKMAPDGT